MAIVLKNTGGIAATNAYVIADEASGDAVLFDAPNDTVAPLLDEIQRRGWNLRGLWLTHGHFDHIADHQVVTERFPEAKVLIHLLDEPKLKHPRSAAFTLPFTIPPRSADGYIGDDEILKIGSIELRAMHTPGHCAGHVSFYLPQEQMLIGGDLIIMGAVGRTDLPDSDEADLFDSIRRVMQLPGNTHLLPGHGQESTLDEERASNPYVRHALGTLE